MNCVETEKTRDVLFAAFVTNLRKTPLTLCSCVLGVESVEFTSLFLQTHAHSALKVSKLAPFLRVVNVGVYLDCTAVNGDV